MIKVAQTFTVTTYLLVTAEIINNSIFPMIFHIPTVLFQVSIYGSMLLVALLFLKGIHIEWRFFLFIIVAALSLVVNEVEAKYSAPFRLGLLILLVSTLGPLVVNPYLLRFRDGLLETFFKSFMLIGGISFIYWVVGLPNMGRGHFTGLMNQSMMLAPLASIGGLYAFHRFIEEPKGRKKMIFLTFFIFSAFDVILAASRTALIAFSLGFSIFLFFNKFKFRGVVLLGLIVGTIFLASGMDDEMNTPQENSILGEMLSRGTKNTRETLWEDRINEFKSSPIFGVGFASQSNVLADKTGEKMGGRIEPGSTYLMVLSMTGLLGAFVLLFFFFRMAINRDFWYRVAIKERFKLATFIFFAVHFIAEGYIYSSGSLLAAIFWLLVGATYPYKGMNYSTTLDKR